MTVRQGDGICPAWPERNLVRLGDMSEAGFFRGFFIMIKIYIKNDSVNWWSYK